MKNGANNPDGKQQGIQLVADYLSTLIAVATSKAAKDEASQSENQIYNELSGFSKAGFLNTGGLEETLEKSIGRESLNAHIKKIQADQIKALTDSQIQALTKENLDKYVGKQVEIRSLKKDESPFDLMFFNPQSGYKSAPYNKPAIKGKIKDVLLTKNVLMVDPSNFSKFMKSGLDSYVVYVIDPETAEPMVDINFL